MLWSHNVGYIGVLGSSWSKYWGYKDIMEKLLGFWGHNRVNIRYCSHKKGVITGYWGHY